MMNKAILQGRLVADPEIRRTNNGTAVASFRLAVDRDFKSKDPNGQNADFINIVAWRQTAEFISRYFHKGSMILLEGRIQTRDYTDNNGQRRYVTEVVAENVNFCGSKNDGNGGNGGNAGNGGYAGNGGGNGGYNANNNGGGGYGGNGGYNANNNGGGYGNNGGGNNYGPSNYGDVVAPSGGFGGANGGGNGDFAAELDDGELPF